MGGKSERSILCLFDYCNHVSLVYFVLGMVLAEVTMGNMGDEMVRGCAWGGVEISKLDGILSTYAGLQRPHHTTSSHYDSSKYTLS